MSLHLFKPNLLDQRKNLLLLYFIVSRNNDRCFLMLKYILLFVHIPIQYTSIQTNRQYTTPEVLLQNIHLLVHVQYTYCMPNDPGSFLTILFYFYVCDKTLSIRKIFVANVYSQKSLDSYHSLPDFSSKFVVGVPVECNILVQSLTTLYSFLHTDILAQNQIPLLLFLFIFLVMCF